MKIFLETCSVYAVKKNIHHVGSVHALLSRNIESQWIFYTLQGSAFYLI